MSTTAIDQGLLRQSNLIEVLIRKKTFWLIFSCMMFFYPLIKSIYRELPAPLPIYSKLPEFNFVNEMGKPFGSKDLKGKVYIANFAFTSCNSSCPMQMQKVQTVQKRVRGLGQTVAIVTFSVDPENDTVDVLQGHARKLNANPFVWTFLTGNLEEMKNILITGFKVPVGDKEKIGNLIDIAHSEKLVLVDKSGSIRGYYSLDGNSINKLMIDLGLLVNNSFKVSHI